MPRFWIISGVLAAGGVFLQAAAQAQVNTWTNALSGVTFKWEDGINWSLGVPPSVFQSAIFITNAASAAPNLRARTVDIDATTAGSFPATMTINNLTVSAPRIGSFSSFNTLLLNNVGPTTPLLITNALTISARGALVVSNSTAAMDTLVVDGGSGLLNGGSILVTNSTRTGLMAIGESEPSGMTVLSGTLIANSAAIGESSGLGTLTIVTGTITFNSPSVPALQVGFGANATGTVWVTGGQLTVSNSLVEVGTGGSLVQSNGVVLEGILSVAGTMVVAGGTNLVGGGGGELQVGHGAIWVMGGLLESDSDTGIIDLSSGGILTQSNGTVRVYGEIIGFSEFSSEGTITLAGGTNIVGDGGVGIGVGSGATTTGTIGTGTVWVTGGQLFATNAASVIGIGTNSTRFIASSETNCVGSLIQSNGIIQAYEEIIGSARGSVGTLTLAGGTNVVGNGGLGVAMGPVSTGTVWVTGGQLTTTLATTYIGEFGNGQMTVSNGTWLAQDVAIGTGGGSQGTLTVAGGTSSVSSSMTLGNSACTSRGMVAVVGGELDVTNASHTAVLDVESGSVVLSSGMLVVDHLVTTNPCASVQQTGGTLVIGGVTNTIASFYITAINQEGNDIRISWVDTAGHTNLVQATSGVGGNYATNFIDLSPQIILPGSGNVTTNYLDTGGATNRPARYYRVRLVP